MFLLSRSVQEYIQNIYIYKCTISPGRFKIYLSNACDMPGILYVSVFSLATKVSVKETNSYLLYYGTMLKPAMGSLSFYQGALSATALVSRPIESALT